MIKLFWTCANSLKLSKKKDKQGYFGSSTPSSKVPLKPNILAENQKKKGGGKNWQEGHGRKSVDEATADYVETLKVPNQCPDCGSKLGKVSSIDRTVIDCEPIKVQKKLYHCEDSWCKKWKKEYKPNQRCLIMGYLEIN